jgi:hypothetical protein
MFTVIVAALFVAALGAALCFVGYRIFLVLLPIIGFFAGFWFGAEVVSIIFGTGFLATVTAWIVGFVAGLVVAVLSYLFYLLGVALVAAAIGAALGSGFMGAFGFDPGLLTAIVALAAAIVAAILTLVWNLQKYVIIALTAIGGANALLLSVLLLIGKVSLQSLRTAGTSIKPILQDSWFWLIVWLVVAIVGIVVQIRLNRDYTFTADRYIEGWG